LLVPDGDLIGHHTTEDYTSFTHPSHEPPADHPFFSPPAPVVGPVSVVLVGIPYETHSRWQEAPTWKGDLTDRWSGVAAIFDPFHSSYVASLTTDVLDAVRHADLAFAVVGSAIPAPVALALGFAHAHEVPIVLVSFGPAIDSVMAGVASAIFTDFEMAVAYTEATYLS